MKRLFSTLSALALALAWGCSQPAAPAGGKADGAADAAKAGAQAAISIRPGLWRTVTTVADVTMPNAPPGMAAQMKGQPTTEESCVTSADVSEFTRKGLVKEDGGQTCSQNTMTSVGGRIEGDSSCQFQGGSSTMHITGTYGAENIDMNVSIATSTPGGAMSQTVRVVSQRIGDCPPG
jgi:hypothetical protein